MKTMIASLVVVLLVSACGKDKGGSTTPLNETQKAQLKEVITASGRGPLAGMASVPSRSNTATDAQTVAMARKLSDAIQAGRCSYSQNKQGDTVQTLSPGDSHLLEVSLTGNDCPIFTKVKMKSYQSSDSRTFGFDVDLNYAAKDAEFANLNDVTAFDLLGGFKITIGNESATGNGTMNGKIKSTKYGDVVATLNFDFNGTQSKQVTNYTAVYQMKDFTAELKVTDETTGNEHHYSYTVNGQTVTKEEFYSYTSENPFLSPTIKR